MYIHMGILSAPVVYCFFYFSWSSAIQNEVT